MAQHCNTTTPPVELDNEAARPKPRFNKRQKKLIEKVAEQRHKYLSYVKKIAATVPEERAMKRSQKLAELEDKFVSTLGDVVNVNPGEYNKLQSWFASTLNWKRNPLNPSLEFNTAGEVRTALADSKRIAENLLEDAGKYTMTGRLNELNKTFNAIVKDLAIPRSDVEALFNEIIEVGNIPKLNAVYGNSEGVRLINGNRYKALEEKLTALKLSPDQIANLRDLATSVHNSFDEVRLAAEALNHNIEALENLGYFPRIPTRDFELRLRKELRKNTALTDVIVAEGVKEVKLLNPLKSVWQKSRTFNYYVPNSVEVVSELFEKPVNEIIDMLNNPNDWVDYLSTMTKGQLDTLVDSGVFDKLPMTSREVFDFMVDEYKLPYEDISEMFKQNPSEAITEYTQRLKRVVGNSAMMQTIAKEGMARGWALSGKQIKKLEPSVAKNFVPLKFTNIDEYLLPDQIEAMGNVYVHKYVADQWKSMLQISVSPVKLGNIAKTWYYLSSFLNKSTLLARNILYVGQNFLSGVVMSHAAGANMATLPSSMMDMFKFWSQGIEGIPNTPDFAKIEGKTYTKREFFREFMLRRGSDAVPGSANVNSTQLALDSLDPRNTKRALEYLWSYADAFKDPVKGVKNASEYMASLITSANSEAFAPFAQAATFVDTFMKWNAAQSLVDRGKFNSINNAMKMATLEISKTFDTWRELTRYIDEYFYTFDDPGTITRGVGQFVRPFAGWAMTSPPAIIRHMLRKPAKFMAYNRLVSAFSGDEQTQAGLTDWQDDEYMITLRNDAMSGGGYMALFPNGYDPIADTVNFIGNTGNNVSVLFGGSTSNARDKRDQLTRKGDAVQDILNGIFTTSYYSKPISILTGVDSFTGEKRDNSKINTFLGVQMSPLAEAVLGFYTPLDSLNRSNPGDIFGRKEYTDAFGNKVVEPKSSVFGQPRTNSDAVNLAWEKATPSEKLLMSLGAKVRIIDRAKNIQMTMGEIQGVVKELKDANIKEQRELTLKKNAIPKDEYEIRLKRLRENIDAEYEIRADLIRVRDYARREGIPPKKAFAQLDKFNLRVQDLPLVGSPERNSLLNEYDIQTDELLE